MSGPRQLTPAELAALEQLAKATAPSLSPVPLWQRDPFTVGAKTTPRPQVPPSMRAPTARERMGDAVRGVGSSVAALPPVQAVLKLLAQAGPGLEQLTYGNVGPGSGWSLGMMPDAPQKATIRAFHGSPHKFDKFSMEKIGTGEGAQVYGHGLYFADSERVAKGYRNKLSEGKDYTVTRTQPQAPEVAEARQQVFARYEPEIERAHAASIDPSLSSNDRTRARLRRDQLEWMRDKEAADVGLPAEASTRIPDWIGRALERNDPVELREIRDDFANRAAESLKRAESGQDHMAREQWANQRQILAVLDDVYNGAAKVTPPGATYEVAIKADPDTLLDYDAPLKEQSEYVRRRLADKQQRYRESEGRVGPYLYDDMPGRAVYHEIAKDTVQEALEREKQRVPTTVVPKDGYVEVLDQQGKFITNVFGSPTEADALQEAASRLGDPRRAFETITPEQIASQKLREVGIPGLKYLDGLSRGAGQGSHNYVIWDDSLIEILRQYGLLGLLGGGLAAQQLRGFTPSPQEAR